VSEKVYVGVKPSIILKKNLTDNIKEDSKSLYVYVESEATVERN